MGPVNPNKAGLVLGSLVGGLHVLWAILAALGWAQPVVDFIFRIHFMKPVFVVDAFSFGTALILIAVTASIGYAVGCIFGVLWNKIHR